LTHAPTALVLKLAEANQCRAACESSRADTTTSHGRLMLTVLGGLAEFERDLIHARTGEGRARAKARGVEMVRKPKLTPHQQAEAIKRREAGEPIREIARTYNVHNSTISRLAAS
jgi:DNA invertase Pin-like site-specific DNA recombinase